MQSTENLPEVLQRHFGFSEFREGQREVIEHLLAGRSAAAVFPTGGGKSLCYQLPALLLDGLTLVVSPLIALMKDQIDALQGRGIAARRLDSTLSADEYRQVISGVRGGDLRLLYVAPERFNNERFREMILRTRIALLAIDEAHCISEWGHNFRPDYLKLAEFARACQAERVLTLTATATPRVLQDVCRVFDIEPKCAITTGVYRPNLTLLTRNVTAEQRDDELLGRIGERARGSTIVYVTLQKTAEELAAKLASQGHPARAYHAGLKDEARAETQDWFLRSPEGIVVATIAFGMGIDKSDIRYIYHYNVPKSLENYAQEIGRAGRDGEPSLCQMFVCPADLNVLENFAYGDTPSPAAVQQFVREVLSLGEHFDVSLYDLAFRHDIRQLVVRTLLTYLELDGYLEGGTPLYSTYRFRARTSSAEILARFDPQRRKFLETVFRQARKGRTWLTLDVQQAADAAGTDRERVVRALDYLSTEGLLELQPAGVRSRYRRLRECQAIDQLAASLHERMVAREQQEIRRLQQVLELAQAENCQVRALCAHFGEARSQPCGHCTACLDGEARGELRERPSGPPLAPHASEARQLFQKHPQVIHEPPVLARLLCGLSSPRLTRAKLTSHRLFGIAAGTPYPEVLAWSEEVLEEKE